MNKTMWNRVATEPRPLTPQELLAIIDQVETPEGYYTVIDGHVALLNKPGKGLAASVTSEAAITHIKPYAPAVRWAGHMMDAIEKRRIEAPIPAYGDMVASIPEFHVEALGRNSVAISGAGHRVNLSRSTEGCWIPVDVPSRDRFLIAAGAYMERMNCMEDHDRW